MIIRLSLDQKEATGIYKSDNNTIVWKTQSTKYDDNKFYTKILLMGFNDTEICNFRVTGPNIDFAIKSHKSWNHLFKEKYPVLEINFIQ